MPKVPKLPPFCRLGKWGTEKWFVQVTVEWLLLGLLVRLPIVSLQDLIPVLAHDSVLFLEFVYVLTTLAMGFWFLTQPCSQALVFWLPQWNGPYLTCSLLGCLEKTCSRYMKWQGLVGITKTWESTKTHLSCCRFRLSPRDSEARRYWQLVWGRTVNSSLLNKIQQLPTWFSHLIVTSEQASINPSCFWTKGILSPSHTKSGLWDQITSLVVDFLH